MPVYIADHDHHEFGTSSKAGSAEVKDQSKAAKYEQEYLDNNPEFKIDEPYLIIRP